MAWIVLTHAMGDEPPVTEFEVGLFVFTLMSTEDLSFRKIEFPPKLAVLADTAVFSFRNPYGTLALRSHFLIPLFQ